MVESQRVRKTTFYLKDLQDSKHGLDQPILYYILRKLSLKSHLYAILLKMISAVILTKNSQPLLSKVLSSLESFSEVIILDTGSTDETINIAKKFSNISTYTSFFEGFGPLRNRGAALAKNDWVMAIDSDEILSEALVEEIRQKSLDENCVYCFPFFNFYNEKQIKWCGWYPENHIRLYNRKKTRFNEKKVHEAIEIENLKIDSFKNPILHYPFRSIDDLLVKSQLYSSLYKQNNPDIRSSVFKAILHGSFAFFKSYFLKRGFLGGREGFIISWYIAHSSFCKYLKLTENKCS